MYNVDIHEVSAKDSTNINNVMNKVAIKLMQREDDLNKYRLQTGGDKNGRNKSMKLGSGKFNSNTSMKDKVYNKLNGLNRNLNNRCNRCDI